MSPRGFSSPRNRNGPHVMSASISAGSHLASGESSLPVDFKPPQNCYSRLETPSYENIHHTSTYVDGKYIDEKKDEIGDGIKFFGREHKRRGYAPSLDENSSSPAAVADVAISSPEVKHDTRILPPDPNKGNNYPSHEEPNPALDDDLVSPLPFDHHEDPTSLMELPANILSLPISPCGPHDGGV